MQRGYMRSGTYYYNNYYVTNLENYLQKLLQLQINIKAFSKSQILHTPSQF